MPQHTVEHVVIIGSHRVVPKSYQREGQPRKTENELTNVGEDGSKPNPIAKLTLNLTLTLSLTLKKKKKLRKET